MYGAALCPIFVSLLLTKTIMQLKSILTSKEIDLKGMFLILVLVTLIGGKLKNAFYDNMKVKFVLDSYEIVKSNDDSFDFESKVR